MIIFTLMFLLGVLYLQTLSRLPDANIMYVLLASGLCFWMVSRKWLPFAGILFAFAAGFTWAAWYACGILSWSLSREWEGKPLQATGYIQSLPVPTPFGERFEFYLEELKDARRVVHPHTSIRLIQPVTGRDQTARLKPGDKWRLLVRLKRIHGTENLGAFDFEAWALQKGLRAIGTVIRSDANRLADHRWHHYPVQQIRHHLQEKMLYYLPPDPASQWLMALVTGERQNMAQNDWQVLRNTGTNHLMAIGGLHIGIMSGFSYFVIMWLWRRCPWLVLRVPAKHAGLAGAFLIASIYGALSGFLIPAQRACVMFAASIFAMLFNKTLSAWRAWSIALLCVLLINPLSVLTESFWLSFGTIALIIYGMSCRVSPSGWWWKWGRVQWVIGVGLMPMTLMLFQQCSLVSFIANSIAIPWLAFCILPICFLGVIFLYVSPLIGVVLLTLAAKSLSLLWLTLSWISRLPVAVWHLNIPNHFIFILTTLGFMILLLPAGWPGRWLGVFWMLPVLFWHAPKPDKGHFWMTLLDVGQGLAVVIQTRHHVLVYDAGPNIANQSDAGERIVVPYLRTLAIRKLDKLVISHGDNDHLGGAQAVINAVTVQAIETSVPEKIKTAYTRYCQRGRTWQWDGVNFSYLYPGDGDFHLGNDSSCVLRIDNGMHQILLPGDIEKFAEKQLIAHYPGELKSDILIAPHHGSKTSGLVAFIQSVHPRYVIYSTGYRNRYHFPHTHVAAAYQRLQAVAYNTADTGMLQFKITKNKQIEDPYSYRQARARYWQDREE
ncbi:hypothetical protein AQUSIP_12080 [Aquicella siphonis]|uniref:Metallo-beta-lactamase domain-containing protein n=1 Tax=Aquicella siphonis TaxID=254247 RepID=A0A5E4PHI2_9COXI|nr:DNA internalization-related competence protein ComEC/Rec2 [Aquicella siphonis]VVC75907.1 hypothetical protein AQUSIP_12080 [Aquicella siphonis]